MPLIHLMAESPIKDLIAFFTVCLKTSFLSITVFKTISKAQLSSSVSVNTSKRIGLSIFVVVRNLSITSLNSTLLRAQKYSYPKSVA